MIGKIIDGRVRQKAQTLEEWNNSTLDSLDGEQLFIRSDVDDAVIGFKFGAKNKTFSELPFIDLTVKDKANPGIVFAGRPSGIYVPTANGNYDGLDVNLAQGYQVIYWDGSIAQKVVYPIDYTTLVFGGVIDDSKDLSNPTEPIWYIAKAGEYNTVPPTSLGVDSILTWNGSEWSHIPFDLEVRGEFLIADNVQELRSIPEQVLQLLVNGTYKGVSLLGYYAKGDTPASIEYYISNTIKEDDGGSVFEVGSVKFEHKFKGEIDCIYFGVKGDGIFDNRTIVQNVSNYCRDNGNIWGFSTKPNISYYISAFVEVYNPINFHDSKITSGSGYIKLFTLKADNISLDRADMEFNLTTGTNAPMFTEAAGCQNIRIVNNKIKNGRISFANANLLNYKDVWIQNNNIDCDFSNYSVGVAQNDVLTLYNLVNVNVDRNVIVAKNTNRVFKVSSFSNDGAIQISDISITGNIIKSNTTSDKQVIDMYQHSRNVTIEGNTFECYGHNSILENKTILPRSIAYSTNLKIINNTFITDGTAIRAFGTYALTGGSGYQNLTFQGNNIFVTSDVASINVMGYHFLDVSQNTFNRSNMSQSNVRVGNCKTAKFSKNDIIGRLNIVADNVIDGNTYTPSFASLSFEDNTFTGIAGVANALLTINNQSNINVLKIRGNDFNLQDSDLSSTRPFIFTNSNVNTLIESNNTSNSPNVPTVGSGATALSRKSSDNSWNDTSFKPDYSSRLSITTSSDINPTLGNEFIEYTGTANATLTIQLNTSMLSGYKKVFRNSSNFPLTISTASGVSIGGNLDLPNLGDTLELYSLSGGASYRIVRWTRSSSLLNYGLTKQAISLPLGSTSDQIITVLKGAGIMAP